MRDRVRLLVAALTVLSATACGDEHDSRAGTTTTGTSLPLVSAEWKIREMATAHGAFTVEVEIATGINTTTLAEALIEPLQDQYAEVLVYFYDRSTDSDLPLLRVQWTAGDGYTTVRY